MAHPTQQVTGHVPKTGVATQHQRLSASAAASIGSLCSGGKVPTIPGHSVFETLTPQVVTLQVEGGAANTVYYTIDGSTPSATNGFVVPVAPAQLVLPYPDLLANAGTVSATNQQIQLFAGGATPTQALFEWW
jgi:hypothetical protein